MPTSHDRVVQELSKKQMPFNSKAFTLTCELVRGAARRHLARETLHSSIEIGGVSEGVLIEPPPAGQQARAAGGAGRLGLGAGVRGGHRLGGWRTRCAAFSHRHADRRAVRVRLEIPATFSGTLNGISQCVPAKCCRDFQTQSH